MDNWEDGEDETYCTAADDFQDARQVCGMLGIPLHKVNFAAEYRERVFQYFLNGYAAGTTPNPDVLCNSEIKFKAFLHHALRLGAEHIATGHYARLVRDSAGVKLFKARDVAKDQSYFLHAVPQGALARSLFPLGEFVKADVRALAREAGFVNHAKKDSTGICFIGERRFGDFLGKYLMAQPGDIASVDGRVLGRHRGLMHYTLGQRSGIGIGGRQDSKDAPWYVADKDPERNVLVVVQGHNHPRLMHSALTAIELHWISGVAPTSPLRCTAKTRYRQTDQACTLNRSSDGSWTASFDQPQRALTPGQYAVFYDGELCLGGGMIAVTGPAGSAHAPLRASG